jgi:hypothetical protein
MPATSWCAVHLLAFPMEDPACPKCAEAAEKRAKLAIRCSTLTAALGDDPDRRAWRVLARVIGDGAPELNGDTGLLDVEDELCSFANMAAEHTPHVIVSWYRDGRLTVKIPLGGPEQELWRRAAAEGV